jgi:hypothetical protein
MKYLLPFTLGAVGGWDKDILESSCRKEKDNKRSEKTQEKQQAD